MTQQDYTHITLVIDRSGSMSSIRDDTEGGIAAFIAEQQKIPGKCTVNLYTFDDTFETKKHMSDLHQFGTFGLRPRGTTALLDAFGKGITLTGEDLNSLPDVERPSNVVFVVVTDGMENASQDWTRDRVFEAVKHQTDTYGWTFVFLAANQDAIAAGQTFGVPSANSMNYTGHTVVSSYASASSSVGSLRGGTGFTSLPDDAPET